MGRGVFVFLIAALAMTACSASDEAASTSSLAPASTNESTSSTTEAPTTTSSETTVDPESVARDAISAAFDQQFVVWRTCTADYDSCDAEVALGPVYSGRALENLTAAVVERQGTGRKDTALDPDPDFQRIDGIEFTADDLSTASVSYCTVDSRRASTVDENGVDVVFNDSVVHEEGIAFYELDDAGMWRLDQFDVLQRSEEIPLCDAS